MTTLVHSRSQSSILDRVGHMIEDIKARYAKYRVYSNTLGELQALSGRELDDLGLNRSLLKSVAYEAAYGR